jgi:hypothetical protein
LQTGTGFNDAEARAYGSDSPPALPMQILDHATGYLIALDAQAAIPELRANSRFATA